MDFTEAEEVEILEFLDLPRGSIYDMSDIVLMIIRKIKELHSIL